MDDDWHSVKVSEIASPVRNALVGGPFGSNLVSRDYVKDGIPVIRGQNMTERWVGGEFVYVTPAKAKSLEANLARPNDIIFTQRGTLGQISLIPNTPYDYYLISQSQMKLTVDRRIADPMFYYYVFHSKEQQEYIRQHTIQTGVPHTNLGILRNAQVPLPPIEEQHIISNILSTLDYRIELNRSMNKTLEEIGKAIFKHWFIDFEFPDKENKSYKSSGGEMTYNKELGKDMPREWRVGTLGEILSLEYGKALTKENRREGIYPVYGSGGISGYHESYTFEGPGLIVGRAGCPGRVHLCGKNFYIIDSAFYVKSEFLFFNYYLLNILDLIYLNTGSAVPGLNRNNVYGVRIILPPKKIILEFDNFCKSLFYMFWRNEEHNVTLSQIRDLLISKIMSRKIRVPVEVK